VVVEEASNFLCTAFPIDNNVVQALSENAVFRDGNGNFEFTMATYHPKLIMAQEATNSKPSMQRE